MKPALKPPPKPGAAIDPRLRPFITALARLLADAEERDAAARRALREAAATLQHSKEKPK